MIRRSHKKSKQGCAECKRSHKRVCLTSLYINIYLYHEISMLILIPPSAMKTEHLVASTVQWPIKNAALLEMSVVRIPARETSLCILAPMKSPGLEVFVHLSFLRLPIRAPSHQYQHQHPHLSPLSTSYIWNCFRISLRVLQRAHPRNYGSKRFFA